MPHAATLLRSDVPHPRMSHMHSHLPLLHNSVRACCATCVCRLFALRLFTWEVAGAGVPIVSAVGGMLLLTKEVARSVVWVHIFCLVAPARVVVRPRPQHVRVVPVCGLRNAPETGAGGQEHGKGS